MPRLSTLGRGTQRGDFGEGQGMASMALLDGRKNMMRQLPDELKCLKSSEVKRDLREIGASKAAGVVAPPAIGPPAAHVSRRAPDSSLFSAAATKRRFKKWAKDLSQMDEELSVRARACVCSLGTGRDGVFPSFLPSESSRVESSRVCCSTAGAAREQRRGAAFAP